MKKIILSTLLISLFVFTSCKNNSEETKEKKVETETEETAQDMEAEPEVGTIVEVAVGNDDFSTLVTALKAAELVETLNGEGPFTVFAPTNDGFGKLPEGTVPTLVKPENKEKLTGILTYHVVSGKFMAEDVVNAVNDNNGSFTVTTVQGEDLTITLDGENVLLTDANGNTSTVVIADVEASNGVVHAIDTVVMPKS